MLGIAVYGFWFKDWAKREYKRGFLPGPKNLRAFTIMYKIHTLFGLLVFITFFILLITGVLD
jgi:hypothetical protein